MLVHVLYNKMKPDSELWFLSGGSHLHNFTSHKYVLYYFIVPFKRKSGHFLFTLLLFKNNTCICETRIVHFFTQRKCMLTFILSNISFCVLDWHKCFVFDLQHRKLINDDDLNMNFGWTVAVLQRYKCWHFP